MCTRCFGADNLQQTPASLVAISLHQVYNSADDDDVVGFPAHQHSREVDKRVPRLLHAKRLFKEAFVEAMEDEVIPRHEGPCQCEP